VILKLLFLSILECKTLISLPVGTVLSNSKGQWDPRMLGLNILHRIKEIKIDKIYKIKVKYIKYILHLLLFAIFEKY
jgi:hypothetical protein